MGREQGRHIMKVTISLAGPLAFRLFRFTYQRFGWKLDFLAKIISREIEAQEKYVAATMMVTKLILEIPSMSNILDRQVVDRLRAVDASVVSLILFPTSDRWKQAARQGFKSLTEQECAELAGLSVTEETLRIYNCEKKS